MTNFFRVDIFVDNEWSFYSYHKNIEYAVANADVHFTSGYPSRVIYEGNVVYQRLDSSS